jgi:hypothetical protein
MDLEKLYVGQKTHDMARIGFMEVKSPLVSRNTESSKNEHSQKTENKRKKI